MEKKLIHKIIVNFVTLGILLITIFSFVLYRHGDKVRSTDVDLVFDQFEAVYEKSQERLRQKQIIYGTDYINKARSIDFFLTQIPDMCDEQGLRELCSYMNEERIHLLDEEGSIRASSETAAVGAKLQNTMEGDYIRELIAGEDEMGSIICLESDNVFQNIPVQDFVAVKSNVEGYAALMAEMNGSILQGMEKKNLLDSVMGSVPLMRDQTLLIIDPENGEILTSTKTDKYGERFEKDVVKTFLSADRRRSMMLDGERTFAKSRVVDDMLLVSLQEYMHGIEAVAVELLGIMIILALIFVFQIYIIRRFLREYVFSEFVMIEDTVKDILKGEENVQFDEGQTGEICSMLQSLTSLTDMNTELKQAAEKSERDGLTGLVNRKGYIRYMENFMKSPDRKGVLLMMDVDNFKLINDNLGHPEGDRVLQKIACCLKSEFREDDLVVRLGGDEFLVFLREEIKEERLKEKLGHLLRRFHKALMPYAKYHASVSIGTAVYTEEITEYETLYQNADEALYEAKQEGKDRYAIKTIEKENNT